MKYTGKHTVMPAIVRSVIIAGAAVATVLPAAAKDKSPPRPAEVEEMVACRTIADSTARLACYDTKVADFEEAENSGDIVIADRAAIKQAQEDTFGLSMRANPLFVDKDGNQIDKLETTIKSAQMTRARKWIFVLENDSTWQQTEIESFRRSPKPGQTIVISRGAFGSYNAEVNGKTTTKVKRIQ